MRKAHEENVNKNTNGKQTQKMYNFIKKKLFLLIKLTKTRNIFNVGWGNRDTS